jgi:hypothetical protein
MAIDTVDQTVTTQEPPTTTGRQTVRTNSSHISETTPGGPETTRRIIVLVFGLIQLVIGLRIVLLLLDAREANGLVAGILTISQLFVFPFEGIFRTNALHAAGSILDVAAIAALVGWTVLELVVNWGVAIFRREPA